MKKTKGTTRPPLSNNIQALRAKKRWNQQDLADEVGVHLNTIKAIEGGHSEGSVENRAAIAKALGVTLADLYIEASTMPDQIDENLANAARTLDAIAKAPLVRRLSALFLASKNETYLEQLLALPDPDAAAYVQLLRRFP